MNLDKAIVLWLIFKMVNVYNENKRKMEEKERFSGIPSENFVWPKGAHLVEVNVSHLDVAHFGLKWARQINHYCRE